MALAFSKEALRALQDVFPIYKTLRTGHAAVPPRAHISGAHGEISCAQPVDVASSRSDNHCLGLLVALLYASCLGLHVLD